MLLKAFVTIRNYVGAYVGPLVTPNIITQLCGKFAKRMVLGTSLRHVFSTVIDCCQRHTGYSCLEGSVSFDVLCRIYLCKRFHIRVRLGVIWVG